MSEVNSQSGLIQLPDEDENDVCWDEYSNWKHWCRLCAKEDRSNIDVFSKKEGSETEFSSGTLATAIGKYFWVNIKTDDELPKQVCGECETLINELCTFTERVNKVQTMFALLQNIRNDKLIDPNELRLQYGLLDEERQHIIRSPEPRSPEYEIDQEVEMLVLDDEQELEDEEEDEKEEIEQQYEQEAEENDHNEDQTEEADEFEEKEVDLKPEMFEDNIEDDEPEEQQEDVEEEQEHELDAEIMEQIEQELEINADEVEINEPENTDATNSISQENPEIEDEDETLLNQVQQEIKELKKFCKKEKPPSLKFKKKVFVKADVPPKTENEEEQQQKTNIKDELHQSDLQISTKTVNDPSDGKSLAIILPPKRRRGRPSRNSDDYERSKKFKLKNEPTDGNGNEEASQVDFKFECSLCPKKYKSCVIYKRHMNDVHNIIDETIVEYTCEECFKSFPSERTLMMHMRTHLPLELKQIFPCPYCEKRFTKEAIMVQHISGAHLNEKPFICEECGRALKTHAALREHKLTHTDNCPFECEVCHKRFKNKARLKIHSDIHAETIYKCAVCGVILNTRRTLNMHMLVHSDVKAFKCDYCGNAFKRAKALKNHLLIHTGLKPYICNFCFKPFSNGSNCRSHKKKAHPEELAAMEASGEKVHQTNVPKLDHLRAVSKAAENLQPVIKQSTLPPNWREILLKAEERATRLDEKCKQEAIKNEDNNSQSQLEESTDIEVEAELAAMEC